MAQLNVNTSIVDYLKSVGQDSSYNNRKKLAEKYGISKYSGTGDQNTLLLNKIKSGTTPRTNNTAGNVVKPVEDKAKAPKAPATPAAVNNPIQSTAVQPVTPQIPAYEQNMPGDYKSPYAQQIDSMLSQIMNRGQFSYNPATDPTYQQYQQQYTQQANLGLRDTMGAAAAMSGGYGNTYATQAGQQTYDSYMGQLNNMIPELYQAALANYQNQLSNDYNKLSALQSLENNSYGQYRDSMSDYYTNRDYYYGKERNQVADNQWQQQYDRSIYEDDRDYDYQVGRDNVADNQWQQTFDYGKKRDKVADNQWQQSYNFDINQFEYGKTQDSINNSFKEKQFKYQQEQDKLDREEAKTNYLNQVAQEQSETAAKESEVRIDRYSKTVDSMLKEKTKNSIDEDVQKYSSAQVVDFLYRSNLNSDEIALIINGNYELLKYVENSANSIRSRGGNVTY